MPHSDRTYRVYATGEGSGSGSLPSEENYRCELSILDWLGKNQTRLDLSDETLNSFEVVLQIVPEQFGHRMDMRFDVGVSVRDTIPTAIILNVFDGNTLLRAYFKAFGSFVDWNTWKKLAGFQAAIPFFDMHMVTSAPKWETRLVQQAAAWALA